MTATGVLNAVLTLSPPTPGSGTFAMENVTTKLPVPVALVAFTVVVNVPTAVGEPEISPVAVLIESPGGKPVALKLIGVLDAIIWKLNATPTVPLAAVPLEITGASRAMVIVSGRAALVPAPLIALTVALNVPCNVGVPEIRPVLLLSKRPAGNPVAA